MKVPFDLWTLKWITQNVVIFYGGDWGTLLRRTLCDLLMLTICVSAHQLWWPKSIRKCSKHLCFCWVTRSSFSFPPFSTNVVNFDVFKPFLGIFYYYRVYQRKLEVITSSQCGLRFVIRPLVFTVKAFEIDKGCENFINFYKKR